MDYVGILKKAWDVTWRYKILWLFGFFAGAGGGLGGNGGGSGYRTGGTSQPFSNWDPAQVQRFLAQYMGVIVLGVAVLVLIGFVALVIGIAARGGLVHLVNEAEEGRQVRAGEGWRVGFSKWWRVFGVLFLVGLPVLVLVLIISGMIGVALVAALRSGSTQDFTAAFGGAIAGGACLAIVLSLVAVFFGVVLGIVGELAVRYVVLRDMAVIESIKQGWHDLFGKRGVFVMFLVLMAVGIVVGIAVGILQLTWVIAPFLAIITGPVLIVLAAVYGAFHQAAWTIFFRRMNGMEPVPAAVAPTGPAGYPGGFPPAPPVMPAPPAPPMVPAPPAPPVAPGMPVPPVAPVAGGPVPPATPPGPLDA